MVFVKVEVSIEIHVTFDIFSYEKFVNILIYLKSITNTTINNIKFVYTSLHMKSNKNFIFANYFYDGYFYFIKNVKHYKGLHLFTYHSTTNCHKTTKNNCLSIFITVKIVKF